jgi:hypothetical protein
MLPPPLQLGITVTASLFITAAHCRQSTNFSNGPHTYRSDDFEDEEESGRIGRIRYKKGESLCCIHKFMLSLRLTEHHAMEA